MRILIKNGHIITGTAANTGMTPGHLLLDGGRIAAVSEQPFPEDATSYDRVIDASGKLIIPGLINGHLHSYANLVKATLENIPLEAWMLYIMQQGRCMDPEDVYYNVLLGCMDMLHTGTMTCIDHLAQGREGLEAALQAYSDAGVRVALAPMISDKGYFSTLPLSTSDIEVLSGYSGQEHIPSATELFSVTVELIREWQDRNDRIRIMFGPSGPQRCSEELLRLCAQGAETYDTGFHTHVLETRIQKETALEFYGKPMIFYLDEIGCLNHRTSLVHAVHLTEEEIELAAQRGAQVVHNPASNLALGSGVAPINSCRRQGVSIALGTDGANCGGNINMFEAMKLTAMIHKCDGSNYSNWLTAQEILAMATRGSSRVSLQEQEIGTIEKGKRADLVILNPERSPALVPRQNPIWQMVYGELGQGVETVIVQGNIVLEDGRVTRFDEDRVRREAEKRSLRIIERVGVYKDQLSGQARFLLGKFYGEQGNNGSMAGIAGAR